ncbi:MAG TPA: SBBP repeat-containing protein [Bryobacteraceae bacterium]|nr:SBBP repeat-containing protein [Bryobacteraceae bacterium]
MQFVPILASLLVAAPLFSAASRSMTAIDVAGNVWRTGQTNSIQTTATAFQKTAVSTVCAMENLSPFQGTTPVYCQHGYLIKQDPTGNVLYATYLGGSSQDGATAITTDSQGNIYIAGYTYSPDFPVTPGVVQTRNAGPLAPVVVSNPEFPYGPTYIAPGGDAFVAKFSPDGALLFSTFLGGSGSDVPSLIAVDAAGAVYISGTTTSSDFPTIGAALTPKTAGYFFARLNAAGAALTYSTYSGSSILAFDLDNTGRVYLTGDFSPPPSSAASGPYVTAVDTSAGSVLNSTFLPSAAPKIGGAGVAIAIATDQNLFLAVSPAPLAQQTFVVTPPFRPLGASYFLKLSSDATRVLAETDVAQAQFDSFLIDSSGNAYAFGHGTGFIPTAAVQPLALPCSENGGSFVLESNPAGAIIAATYFRQGDDTAVSLASPGRITFYNTSSSIAMQIDLTAQPAANFACPQNLASSVINQGIAPGEIFLLSGVGLGPSPAVGAMPDGAGQYPTSLGGVQVLFGSQPAPLLFVQANEIHAVAPFSFPFASNQPVIQVRVGSQIVASLEVAGYNSNAAIFTIKGQGAIVNQDGTVNTPASPARLGSIVSIYASGMGYLTNASHTVLNPLADGQVTPLPPPYFYTSIYAPQVFFAGVAGTTLFSGAAPGLIAGVTQINVQLPSSLPDGTVWNAVPVVLDVAGTKAPAVLISLQP